MNPTLQFALVLLLAATPREEAKLNARNMIADANNDFQKARYEAAAEKYLAAHALVEAHELTPKPELLFNAGLAYERVGRCDEVARLYGQYLRARPKADSGDLRFRYDNARRCAPPITFVTEPPGATVVVDDRPRGLTPLRVYLVRGPHAVRLIRDGHGTKDDAVVVEEGQPQTLTHEMVRLEVPALVSVVVPDGVRLMIDDSLQIDGPRAEILSMEEGQHVFRAERAGCDPRSTTLALIAGAAVVPFRAEASCQGGADAPPRAGAVIASPEQTPSKVSPWVYAGGVTGGATIVTSLVFGIVSAQAVSAQDFERAKPASQQDAGALADAESRASGFAIAAVTTAGVGVALLLVTILYEALRDPPAEAEATARAVTAGRSGLSLRF